MIDWGDAAEPDLEGEFPLGDGTADAGASVVCPYCAQAVEVTLDPGSGATQSYIEDCEICCRPWQVSVTYDQNGRAWVSLSTLDG
jgi:hypothetical protein